MAISGLITLADNDFIRLRFALVRRIIKQVEFTMTINSLHNRLKIDTQIGVRITGLHTASCHRLDQSIKLIIDSDEEDILTATHMAQFPIRLSGRTACSVQEGEGGDAADRL